MNNTIEDVTGLNLDPSGHFRAVMLILATLGFFAVMLIAVLIVSAAR